MLYVFPRHACAARVTVIVLCVCVCPGHSSATHATTRRSRHTVPTDSVLCSLQNDMVFSYNGFVTKIAIAFPILTSARVGLFSGSFSAFLPYAIVIHL